MSHQPIIEQRLKDAFELRQSVLENLELRQAVDKAAGLLYLALRNNRAVHFCGNGGSAADAQHLAAELSGRYYLNRKPLNAEALHVNTSYLTATANDFGFDQVYSRLLEAKAKEGDVLVALSTSGNSANVVNAVKQACKQEMVVIGLTGKNTSQIDEHCHVLIKVPSSDTPRIQEIHILLGHIICEIVEQEMFGV
ncbi:D-sedoheptulose 7-phosphate isomerase [soil metagenome]